MAKINSRAKGKTGEREVAKLLQKYWSNFEDGIQFCSTPLSGGFGNAKMRGDMKIAGDLMTNSLVFPFCIEIKRREKWNLERLLSGKSSPVWGWYEQCCKAAEEEKKIPMLWFRKNREEWLILVPESSTTAFGHPHKEIARPKKLPELCLTHYPVLIEAKVFLENVD